MKFCTKCGSPLSDEQAFCGICGNKIEQPTEQRKQVFEGDVHKCPKCGYELESFSANCPYCGFELRNTKTSNAVTSFKNLFDNATYEKKIHILQNFVVPNNKEDIFEFMCMAESNFDEDYYVTHINEQDLSDVWLSTIKKCQTKAQLIFDRDSDLNKINNIVDNINKRIKFAKSRRLKNNITGILLIAFAVLSALLSRIPISDPTLLFVSSIFSVSTVLCLVLGIVILVKANKKKEIIDNIEIPQKGNYKHKPTTHGFSSWSLPEKICWVVLNIYTFGIPAIIYNRKHKNKE